MRQTGDNVNAENLWNPLRRAPFHIRFAACLPHRCTGKMSAEMSRNHNETNNKLNTGRVSDSGTTALHHTPAKSAFLIADD